MICHYGNIKIGPLGNATIYGGGLTRGATIHNKMIVLDLSGKLIIRPVVKFSGVTPPESLLQAAQPEVELLNFDWDDYGVPMVGRTFWVELVNWLKERPMDVLVCCDGGHGRTGTALAIIAALGDLCKGDPVRWIRKVYCPKAVESESQIEYVKQITGRVVTCKASGIVILDKEYPMTWI